MHNHAHGHHHGHGHAPVEDEAFWNRMYGHRPAPAGPNEFLAEDVADLAPGTALDLGCGQGADALWLAKHGWRVTGVDLSSVALESARAADADGLVTWEQGDMQTWQPPEHAYDLVKLHFVHVPVALRPALFDRLARSLRPGGTLLVVAHHPSDQGTTLGRPNLPDLYYTAEELVQWLPGLAVVANGTRSRQVSDRDGQPITIEDTLFKARK